MSINEPARNVSWGQKGKLKNFSRRNLQLEIWPDAVGLPMRSGD